MEWFSVSSQVLERKDLNIYEKMCYVMLAKTLQEASINDLTMVELASFMGVEEIVAKGAFYALRAKGIIESSDSSIKPGMIIKADKADEFVKSDLTTMSYDAKVVKVFEIIDEKINEREARIILNFANNDLEKIEEKYRMAKASQYNDKIEVLIHELQKKQQGRIIKKEEVKEQIKPFENFLESEPTKQTQVNTYKINMMKKYKKKED